MPPEKSNAAENVSEREIVSVRTFHGAREALWQAFADPAQLARWWGPKGFTNTIEAFDLRPGGAWRIVLHAPGGANFVNEKTFLEVVPTERVVFRHEQPMHSFQMTIRFDAHPPGTRVTWHLLFDRAEECAKVKPLIVAANEENFDRLEAHLRGQSLSAQS
jgi:uncharacterized protein YndB with AHSA1/START domain